jgi:hypothetical protein
MIKGIIFGALLIVIGSLGFIFQPIIAVGALIVGGGIIFLAIRYRHELKGPPKRYERPPSDLDHLQRKPEKPPSHLFRH